MKNVIIGIVAFIAAAFGIAKTIEMQERYNCPAITVTVQSGDTEWSIIKGNCTGNIQVPVSKLADKYGTVIHVGQQIQLP